MSGCYKRLVGAGCEIKSHESDLYVKATDEARSIVRESGLEWKYFLSNRDGSLWIEVPFAYDPWWEARRSE